MPARCWIAPDTPKPMYRFGAMTLPVWPTCRSAGASPASTTARVAPMAALHLSASGNMSFSKPSLFLRPRPPQTTLAAVARSGRSLFESWSSTHFDLPTAGSASPSLTAPLPPSAAARSNAVPRTVMNFTASFDVTTLTALPAYVKRLNVSSDSTPTMSAIAIASSFTAARGMTPLPKADAPASTCVYEPSWATLETTGATSSGRPLAYCSPSTASTSATPLTAASFAAASLAPLVATSAVTGPILAAAVIVASVAAETAPSAISATTSDFPRARAV
mmetsp:Transcript_30366/g.93731  ORF Transcript_30366/g.93731 Transcript_30366/m.93731 type:complete len:277 (-) Transcript_30366:39-869(-)